MALSLSQQASGSRKTIPKNKICMYVCNRVLCCLETPALMAIQNPSSDPLNLKPQLRGRLFCVRFFDKNGCGKVAWYSIMVLIVIKVTLLLKMTVSSCFHSDSDI